MTYSTKDLLRWAALGACRVEFGGNDLVFERPGCVRRATRPLTEAERAMLVQVDADLFAQRPPWPALARPWPDFSHELPATRVRMLRRSRLALARADLRRLRVGEERWFRRPLAVVRAECVRLLSALGHPRFATLLTAHTERAG